MVLKLSALVGVSTRRLVALRLAVTPVQTVWALMAVSTSAWVALAKLIRRPLSISVPLLAASGIALTLVTGLKEATPLSTRPQAAIRVLVEPAWIETFEVLVRETGRNLPGPVYMSSPGRIGTSTLPSTPLSTRSRPWSKYWPQEARYML